ncbi:UBP-type zinc finger domain-containing protein [Pedobacter sp. MC2016-05]|uniref:UBP-type zinc finger domain-containing protein n=1 Tax=Pedobacter sp. MC2016-05 TaxID=2994474 RepID=UPI0022463483|nr:UBP-type zinc finger domain-containing protein [Pedobacter sp. MC2016-05]MCX2475837.1 UBP-type zinc finger domain-containing protein [Pedobacter sp. MC2016-05]
MENNGICQHIKAIKTLKVAKEYACEECIKIGSDWVHLRTCQTCGVTLCCDSSPMQHMSQHCKKVSHPVVISSEPGERWLYCYVDDEMDGY